MTLPNTPMAYTDCYDLLDKAIEDPRGIRVEMKNVDAATFFRMRIHQARAIDRKANAQTYEPGQPLHNASTYDKLAIRIRKMHDKWWLYIEKYMEVPLERIESLTGLPEADFTEYAIVDETPQITAASPKQLTFRRL